MYSDTLIEFVEGKFLEHEIRKVIPDTKDLSQAFRKMAQLVDAQRAAEVVMNDPNRPVSPTPKNLSLPRQGTSQKEPGMELGPSGVESSRGGHA